MHFDNSRLASLTVAAVLIASLSECGGTAEQEQNLVIIALDTLRPDHLGCYGYARDTSPNLDAWSRNAVVFDRVESAAPWTAPSLLSLMTSLYPSVHGVARFPDPGRMNDRVTTLAEVLKKRGYTTGAFTDGGFAKAQFGLGQGFDVYPPNDGDSLQDHSSNLREPSRVRPNVDRTLAWLDGVQNEPFFLFFHTYEVHTPYHPPEEYVKLFRPSYDDQAEHARLWQIMRAWIDKREVDAEGARLLMAHKEHCNPIDRVEAELLAERAKELGVEELEPERMQFLRDLYDAEIRHTDAELERLLARLEGAKLRDNTVIVFVSDHGEGFGEHGQVGHGNVLHNEALRVLLMMRAPGIDPQRVDQVVRSVDVMPTVLDLLGVPRAGLGMQGRSIAKLLRGDALANEPTFSHGLSRSDNEMRLWSVRDGKWRYIWNEGKRSGRLFDLDADPGELVDVAGEQAPTAERMRGLLRAQRVLDGKVRAEFSGPVGGYEFDGTTWNDLKKLGYVDGEQENAEASRPVLPIPTFGESGPVQDERGQTREERGG